MKGRFGLLAALLLAASLTAGEWAVPATARQATPATGCRAVAHALGETCVPVRPERIASLAMELTDILVALDRPPAAAVTYADADAATYPDHLAGEVAGIAPLGAAGAAELNLETLARLKPDLIVGFEWLGDHYQELSAIAPTVLIEEFRGGAIDWKLWLADLAAATGADAEAAQLLADYEARTKDLRSKVDGTTVAVAHPYLGALFLYGPKSGVGIALADAGIAVEVPVGADPPDGAYPTVSEELIPELTAEHLFVLTYGLEDATVEEYIGRPIWQTVPAVSAGRVHPVDGLAWSNHGYFGVMRVLDEVEAALAPADKETAL